MNNGVSSLVVEAVKLEDGKTKVQYIRRLLEPETDCTICSIVRKLLYYQSFLTIQLRRYIINS